MIIIHLNAATDMLAAINADLANDPNFTMTRDQLRTRIRNYCDHPDTTDADIDSIYRILEPNIRCFRD